MNNVGSVSFVTIPIWIALPVLALAVFLGWKLLKLILAALD